VAADDFALKGKRLAVVALDLVNRRYVGSDDGCYPQADTTQIEARFYEDPPGRRARDCPRRMLKRFDGDLYSWRERSRQVVLPLQGLEDLASVQRAPLRFIGGSTSQHERAKFLSGWLFWLRVQGAVESMLQRRGLPEALPVIVGVNQVSWPMESNQCDYGPKAECLYFATEVSVDPAERRKIIDARRAEEKAKELAFWRDILDQYEAMTTYLSRRQTGD
jgi:hypothetical protein